MAGLLDQYTHAGNTRALQMVTRMADYFANRVKNVIQYYSIERHWTSLNDETGGMNDVLYRLYRITGDQKHLTLAHLFDKPCFLGPLALKVDDLSGFHANTHIPVVIGAEMRYEVTRDPLYKYTGMMLLEEMAFILITPYLLIFGVPKRVDDIVRFISDFSVDVEGVGHVCSFSAFDFVSHGNKNYGSPCDAARSTRSSQGKMEKSFLR